MIKIIFAGLAFLLSFSVQASAANWAEWTRSPHYIMKSQYGIAGDPSIIKISNEYRLFYGCFDPMRKPQGTDICLATSTDSLNWTLPDRGNKYVLGQVMTPDSESWHTANETPFILHFQNKYFLYFTGYKDKGGIFNSSPANLGLVTSPDGINFPEPAIPVLRASPSGYDQSAIASPSIIVEDNKLYMVYAAYCLTASCHPKPGTALMMATSSDGVQWTRTSDTLFNSDTPLPAFIKSAYDMGEPELIKGPDGYFYLFFTATQGDQPHMIGVARSKTLDGPWNFNPDPIITVQSGETEVVAPNVRIEGNRVRMWFSAFTTDPGIHIGYAEAPWPLVQP